MKKSLYFDFAAALGAPASAPTAGDRTPRLPIRHADIVYFATDGNRMIGQEFDGRYGYLYSYEIQLRQSVQIPVRVDLPDMHVLYLMAANHDISLCDTGQIPPFCLSPERACYLYLPIGEYRLHIPSGHSHLFGFYFDGKIFRKGNERPFSFIADLIQAYRQRANQAMSSPHFAIGPRILTHIRYLCENMQHGKLSNEAFIQQSLVQLIELSKEKIFEEYDRISNPEYLIRRGRKLLGDMIQLHGNKAQITDVAHQLRVRPEYLSRVHKRYFPMTLSDYRNKLLEEKIKALLTGYKSLLEISLECGFHGPSELSRFFKKHSGLTPAQYRASLKNNK